MADRELERKNEAEVKAGRRKYPKPGEKWRHFKGGMYEIVCTVQHTENRKWYVMYKALEDFGKAEKDQIYLLPALMFMSKTDKRKYPEAEQDYRFELVKEL